MSLDMYSVIERGKHAPSFDKLEQMAERLGVTVAYLFTFPEPANNDPMSECYMLCRWDKQRI